MNEPMRLMCVLAHPDDESLGTGGLLAKYAAEGVETYLITATRGEAGWFGQWSDYPGPEKLGALREQELNCAANQLGLRQIFLLGYMDGELDQAPPGEVIEKIAAIYRQVRPQVVVTFDPAGVYGHPDHIAISQFALAAAVKAAGEGGAHPPHQVSKLYYSIETEEVLAMYQQVFGELKMTIDGVERHAEGWKDWMITTIVDTTTYWQVIWDAIRCHQSQLPGFSEMLALPEDRRQALFGTQYFYRVYSLVNGGREIETDLFAGVRERMIPAGG
ncbi:MAG TPA: PIG-L family deacetylase [Chloroflexi bacterium]|mgnify:CR=1 FL=1|nr:PIG-L family deacetylase [Chloroflexota bacterium]